MSTPARKTAVLIGECMIELGPTPEHPRLLERRFGGDTLNTCVYLARLLDNAPVDVAYATRLGDDPASAAMAAAWASEGIDTRHVVLAPGRTAGLYMIHLDPSGERTFSYWRGEAPARELFRADLPPRVADIEGADLVFASGITLAILSDEGRAALLGLMRRTAERGGIAAFDTNFRARLWPDRDAARRWIGAALGAATVALPSLDDLSGLYGIKTVDEALALPDLAETRTCVLKTGGGPIVLVEGGARRTFTPERIANPVDTTAAGDAFDAGVLAALLTGRAAMQGIELGHALAARVVQHAGAIVPRAATADLTPPAPSE